MEHEYLDLNRKVWDDRVEDHARSDFYNLEGFKAGLNPLNDVEINLLGDLSNKSLLHLQCHFGMDTLALAGMGANVTGIDFSPVAIAKAKELAAELNVKAQFVCCDVYAVPGVVNEQFDIVFTSYGTIGWLPDIHAWANTVSQMMKPGADFVMVDFHPVVWMMDDDFTHIAYPYFHGDPIVETTEGSYANRESSVKNTSVGWNHSLGDLLGSLLAVGIEITHFEEYDYSPYACFQHLEQIGPGKYQVKHLKGKIPMLYSIKGRKK